MPASCSCLYRAEREFWGVLGASQLKSCQPLTARKAVMVSWEPVPWQGRCFPNPWVLRDFPMEVPAVKPRVKVPNPCKKQGRKRANRWRLGQWVISSHTQVRFGEAR